ncbi:hypothetical protein CVT26_012220 [Gymnopilus dilepis]|uniref:Uncharacterized protein n=1 Tax=Gymnopilus dilepis TaxID=231916 RepID=A0A409YQ50_9AGAR|nr:hypothetical protein CVT26_012220 [Gymnopilus dilepis]
MTVAPLARTRSFRPSRTDIPQSPNSNGDSPIFILPNEIFCSIFIHARNASLVSGFFSLTARTQEIIISHVCGLWRSIALNYPSLWDTIRYGTPRSSKIKVKDRFAAYIERSGNNLLDIWLNFRGDYRNVRLEDHKTMFAVLLSEVERWRRVTILLDANLHWPEICHNLQDLHVPNLEHFTLCTDHVARSRYITSSPTLFKAGTPYLRSVRLTTEDYKRSLPSLRAITTLRLETWATSSGVWVSLSTVIDVLAIPCLENLSIAGIQMSEPMNVDNRTKNIKATKLKDFRCASDSVVELMELIQMPSLSILTLRNVKFPVLSSKSAPQLTELILVNCQVSWNAFHDDLFHLSSKITHLTISEDSGGTFRKHAVDDFLMNNGWPQLQSLRCNIQPESRVEFYLQLALDQPFVVYVHQNLLDMWAERSPDLLVFIDGKCILQSFDSDRSPLIPWQWPYSDDPLYHPFDRLDSDPFRVASYH